MEKQPLQIILRTIFQKLKAYTMYVSSNKYVWASDGMPKCFAKFASKGKPSCKTLFEKLKAHNYMYQYEKICQHETILACN